MLKTVGGWTTLLLLVICAPDRAEALRVEEFMAICTAAGRECAEVPILNAYVGGALDLVAMLHEETEYIEPIYCRDPELLFDVPAIIRYIEARRAGNEDKNAMLLVIRFLEEHGGC